MLSMTGKDLREIQLPPNKPYVLAFWGTLLTFRRRANCGGQLTVPASDREQAPEEPE